MDLSQKDFGDLADDMIASVRERIPELTDFNPGSVVRTLLESFAYELAVIHKEMELVYEAGFIDTAKGVHLDRVVAVLGIERTEADFASGEATFERDPIFTEKLTIPLGTQVATQSDPLLVPPQKIYVTTQEGVFAPDQIEITLPIQAIIRGRENITPAHTIVSLPQRPPGVKAVTNRRPIRFFGEDRETDAALRLRAKRELLASGRASQTSIENALLKQPEVRQVLVQEDFRPPDQGGLGPGVVEVYVDALTPSNTPLLRQALNEVRAAGIYAILKSAELIYANINIRVELVKNANTDGKLQIRQAVVKSLTTFIEAMSMGEPLRIAPLIAVIVDTPGVLDLADLRIETVQETGLEDVRIVHPVDVKRIDLGAHQRFAAGDLIVALSGEGIDPR